MRVSVTEAKAQLTDLVRRAEAGHEVTLTRHDQDVARIVAVPGAGGAAERYRRISRIQAAARP